MRRPLRSLARLAMVCQLAATIAIVAPAMSAAVEAAGADGCTCPLHSGATCPMHHDGADKATCRIGCADTGAPAAIVSLLGPIGLIPTSAPLAIVGARAPLAAAAATSPIDRPLVPDAPPPRV